MRIALVSIALVAVATVAAAAMHQQTPTGDRWEYLLLSSGTKRERQQAELDSLGREGWELAAVLGIEAGGSQGPGFVVSETSKAILYLKRRAP